MTRPVYNLTNADIGAIIKIITTWNRKEKFSWDALLKVIEVRLGKRWSRQALDRHVSISDAYKLRKAKNRAMPLRPDDETTPSEIRLAREELSELRFENELLMKEICAYQEKFTLWAYNAHTRGMTERDLSRPLPQVDRRSTRDD